MVAEESLWDLTGMEFEAVQEEQSAATAGTAKPEVTPEVGAEKPNSDTESPAAVSAPKTENTVKPGLQPNVQSKANDSMDDLFGAGSRGFQKKKPEEVQTTILSAGNHKKLPPKEDMKN